MQTFVISLQTESGRREHVLRECSRFGLNPVLIDAVDMRGQPDEVLRRCQAAPEARRTSRRHYLSAGEVGCALSHLSVYRRIVQKNIEHALILEDDVYFLSDPAELLSRLNDIQRACAFDVLILGRVKTRPEQLQDYYTINPIRHMLSVGRFSVGTPWKQYSAGALAYVIIRSGAEKILSITEKIETVIDDWRFFAEHCDLKVLQLRPWLALEKTDTFSSAIRDDVRTSLSVSGARLFRKKLKGRVRNFLMNRGR